MAASKAVFLLGVVFIAAVATEVVAETEAARTVLLLGDELKADAHQGRDLLWDFAVEPINQAQAATNQGDGFFGGKDINQAAQAIDQSGLGRGINQGQAAANQGKKLLQLDVQQTRGLLWEKERKEEKKVVKEKKEEKVVKVFPVGGIDQAQAALNQGDGFGKKDINQAAQAIEQGHRRMLLGVKKGGKDINQAAQAIDQGRNIGGINQAQAAANQGGGFFGGKAINQAAQAIDQSGRGKGINQGQAAANQGKKLLQLDAQQARGLLWEKERKVEKKVVKVFPVGGIDQAQAALNQGDGFGKKDINQAAQAIEQGHRRMLLGAKRGGKNNQAAQAIDQGKKFGAGIKQAQIATNQG